MTHRHFSSRTPVQLDASPLTMQLAHYAGAIDLNVSNPTRPELGFDVPYAAIAEALAQSAHGVYAAEPLGMLSARHAVRDYLHGAGMHAAIDVDQIMLTASTSEAYGMLLKLLCDPGDRIGVGAPGYPLVQHLAELESVQCDYFAWEYAEGRWQLDRESVLQVFASQPSALHDGEAAPQRGTLKAIVIVGPNNPTGACLDEETWHWLRAQCAHHGVAIISDEVFAPYGFHGGFMPGALRGHVAALPDFSTYPLLFVLDGLSKAAALPQMKIAWTVVAGPHDLVHEAMQRLEWIGDAYLSASAPMQRALPAMLAMAPAIQDQIRTRVIGNYAVLRSLLQKHDVHAVELFHAEGGWYAVLRVPCVMDEDAWVLFLAQHAGVVVQPGYYFDFSTHGYLVLGLLLPPSKYTIAVEGLIQAFSRHLSVSP